MWQTQGYEEELRSERSYVAGLYARLDAERARVKGEYQRGVGRRIRRDADGTRRRGARAGQRGEAAGRGGQRAVLRPVGHCFGRAFLHRPDRPFRRGERVRAGAARLAGAGVARVLRRHRRPARRTCAGAASSTPAGARWSTSPTRCSAAPVTATRGDAALLAAVNAPRGEGMRDIVATIQAEQDEIIRLDHPGVLVIEGGPGTGKTVVALHRVAYLLYTQRERMERHGVLVVGPNPAFLNHIGRVLPSLGETDVVFMTTGDFVPGLHVTAEDTPEAARLKGSLKILRRARGGGRRPAAAARAIRCRSSWRTSRCGSTPRPPSGPGTRRARAGCRTTRPARCSSSRHLRAHRTGDRPDRRGLADPGRPRGLGATAGRPARRARRQRGVHRRARRTLADADAGNPVGRAVLVTRAAARGRRRPGAVARRRRRLDGVGRATARRTGRPAGPRQGGRRSRRAGAQGPKPSTPPACWT